MSRFPDAGITDALASNFRAGCEAFIAAMRAAGASVEISSTRRPTERAYLMHYSWRIHRKTINPQNVPAKRGVDIQWVHRGADGSIDILKSRQAATARVNAYNIAFQSALMSRHVTGQAIDMAIAWKGTLALKTIKGDATTISSTPRNGLNLLLRRVGKTYGVIKLPSDPPHWSTDGK